MFFHCKIHAHARTHTARAHYLQPEVWFGREERWKGPSVHKPPLHLAAREVVCTWGGGREGGREGGSESEGMEGGR